MKQISALLLLASLAAPAFAADEAPTYRLVKKIDVDYNDEAFYKWDKNGRLVEITENRPWDQVFLTKVFTYDNQGRIVRQDMYQSFDGDDNYVLVNYLTYEYDEESRLSRRYNYNRDPEFPDNPMENMGVYVYLYGENGKLAERQTYPDAESVDPANLKQRVSYIYDESDRLYQMSEMMYYTGTGWVDNGYLRYGYDKEGRKATCIRMLYDNGVEILGGFLGYEYDEQGSLSGIFTANAAGRRQTQANYAHSEIPSEQVVYPRTHETEYDNEVYDMSLFQITTIEEFQTANEDNELHRSANWELVYELVTNGEDNAIDAINADGHNPFTVRSVDGKLTLIGVDKADNVRVLDMSGRLVKNFGATGSSIDVSNLPGGVYVLSTNDGAVKFVR